MRNLLLIICAYMLASCATTTNYYTSTVQSWKGGSIDNLIQRWGRPDQRTKTPDGNIAYMYQTASYHNNTSPNAVNFTPSGRQAINSAGTANRGGISYSCITTFIANHKGQIINIDIQGHGCYGSSSFANHKSNPAAQGV